MERTAADVEAQSVGGRSRRDALVEACRYCGRPEHLRRTLLIALVVGTVLTAINQLDVILRGDATAATAVKCGFNYVVPFIVSNLGLLTGRRHHPGDGDGSDP
jgi:hypothetical protein